LRNKRRNVHGRTSARIARDWHRLVYQRRGDPLSGGVGADPDDRTLTDDSSIEVNGFWTPISISFTGEHLDHFIAHCDA
jgi:hypothetical protein